METYEIIVFKEQSACSRLYTLIPERVFVDTV